MAEEYKVVAPLVYLRYRDLGGSVVQGTFYQGAVITKEAGKDPAPGAVIAEGPGSIAHHLETEQIVPLDDPVAEIFGPAGTPLPGHAPNVPLQEGGDPVIVEESGSKVQRVRKAAPGIPDEAPGSKSSDQGQDGAPPRSAEKPAWVAYAKSQGASDDEANNSTKEELIAKYGDRR
jgi:hypothetical protein